MSTGPEWLTPTSLEEALRFEPSAGRRRRSSRVARSSASSSVSAARAIVVSQSPASHRLDFVDANGELLRLGAMTRHRTVERSAAVQQGWPALAATFAVVASPRVRNQATVGGVLADADYASDPPAMLVAMGARVVAGASRGEREIPIDELIVGHYQTSLARGRADHGGSRARRRASCGLPQVPLPLARGSTVRRRRRLPEARQSAGGRRSRCRPAPVLPGALRSVADPAELARAYADAIDDPISDVSGSSAYRRRVVAVEVRRALEELG